MYIGGASQRYVFCGVAGNSPYRLCADSVPFMRTRRTVYAQTWLLIRTVYAHSPYRLCALLPLDPYRFSAKAVPFQRTFAFTREQRVIENKGAHSQKSHCIVY